jgi:2,3-bisphosphoglycerate-independent phosphoglycerate mutase
MEFNMIRSMLRSADTKIVLLVMDGLGGLPREKNGLTELETARMQNMDQVAVDSVCGLHIPVHDGITPGSGPSHLALFGYDPLVYQVGRGTLAALGIDFDLHSEDVAARGNFCTIDENGLITDRRAGRISTEKNKLLCKLLQKIELSGVQTFVEPVKDYRFLLVLRGEDLSPEVVDTDPQTIGKAPLSPRYIKKEAEPTVRILQKFLDQAQTILAEHHPANMMLLRGFSKRPRWPLMQEVFGLRCGAIAAYPMYRGLAKLVGMEIIETGETLEEEIEALEKHWNDFDFFYVHIKPIDSAGEDGDFGRKVALLEEVDAKIPLLMNLNPDVFIVTGDHSTPSVIKSHSWHPVPVFINSVRCRPDIVEEFSERACLSGALGPRFPAKDLMLLALANAQRLEKYGA